MRNLTETLKKIKEETRGAACFYDPLLKKYKCYNGLTHQEAKNAAKATGVKLSQWAAGAKCTDIQCGD